MLVFLLLSKELECKTALRKILVERKPFVYTQNQRQLYFNLGRTWHCCTLISVQFLGVLLSIVIEPPYLGTELSSLMSTDFN